MMMDVTEAEADRIVHILAPELADTEGLEIGQALAEARSKAPPESRGLTMQLRSIDSARLAGPRARVVIDEIPKP
jgi:hypothetical protein